jgi:putative transposase
MNPSWNGKDLLPEKQVKRVLEKQSRVEEFRRSGLSLSRFARQHQIPLATLARDVKMAAQGVQGFLDRRLRNKGRPRKIEDRALGWVLSHLATYPKASLRSAWVELGPVALQQHWNYPSYDQILRVVRGMPADLRELMANGAKAQFQEYGIVSRRVDHLPNELWQIDATELDLWVLDTASGELFRPWMTTCIDGASRVILCAWLHRGEPDTAGTLQALRRAILPKDSESYPFYGIPQRLQSDNGTVYRSADFLEALLRLGIEKADIPNDCPGADGKVERWFRTFKDQLLKSLHGFAGQHAALAKARRNAIPWPLLPKLVEDYLFKYHLAQHSELNTTPWEAWHQKLADAKGLNLVVQDVVDAIKIRRDVTVDRQGIELLPGRHYHSPKLAGLVGETITLRIPPEGPGDAVEAYHKGDFIDHLRCVESSPSLARQIGEARLERVVELQKLRKTLRETAEKVIPKATEGEVGGGPVAPEIPTNPAPEVSGTNPNETALNIPKLKTEEPHE